MDEPFAALDALTRRRMQDELLQLWQDTRFTVLFVTHSIAEAIRIGNRILLLSPHPGEVKAEVEDVEAAMTSEGGPQRLEKQIHDLLFMEEDADEAALRKLGQEAAQQEAAQEAVAEDAHHG